MVSCLCAAGLGCSRETVAEPEVQHARDELSAGPASLEIGEASGGSASRCKSGVSVHYGPDPDTLHACSTLCDDDYDCPYDDGWRCITFIPGNAKGKICAPGQSWSGKKAGPPRGRQTGAGRTINHASATAPSVDGGVYRVLGMVPIDGGSP